MLCSHRVSFASKKMKIICCFSSSHQCSLNQLATLPSEQEDREREKNRKKKKALAEHCLPGCTEHCVSSYGVFWSSGSFRSLQRSEQWSTESLNTGFYQLFLNTTGGPGRWGRAYAVITSSVRGVQSHSFCEKPKASLSSKEKAKSHLNLFK